MTSTTTASSAEEIRQVMASATEVFESVRPRVEVLARTYEVAGLPLRVEYAGSMGRRLIPGLEHLEAPIEHPDLTIRAFDAASTCTAAPLSPESANGLILRGTAAADPVVDICATYGKPDSGLSVFDPVQRTAIYWVPDAAGIPYWERAAPFRGILSLWMASRGRRFVHAAAVGVGGAAVLLVGRGGSGKSTTALQCLADGMDYAGDDYCIVDVAALRVFSAYRSAKLRPDSIRRLPWLEGKAENQDEGDEKLVYFPPANGGAIGRSMRIAAIVAPRVTGAKTPRLLPTTAAAVLAAIAPTTLLQLTHTDATALRDFARLAKAVPAYTLDLGEDVEQVPDLLRSVLGR